MRRHRSPPTLPYLSAGGRRPTVTPNLSASKRPRIRRWSEPSPFRPVQGRCRRFGRVDAGHLRIARCPAPEGRPQHDFAAPRLADRAPRARTTDRSSWWRRMAPAAYCERAEGSRHGGSEAPWRHPVRRRQRPGCEAAVSSSGERLRPTTDAQRCVGPDQIRPVRKPRIPRGGPQAARSSARRRPSPSRQNPADRHRGTPRRRTGRSPRHALAQPSTHRGHRDLRGETSKSNLGAARAGEARRFDDASPWPN